MIDDREGNRTAHVADDIVGRGIIKIFTNGDLPTNPMLLSECLVCGGIFTFEDSWPHYKSECKVSPEQPFALVAGW
ncbi:MAG: hypothetical protein ABSE28_22355 [Candidatus Sulfotelmatobacter sp.]|jgi:hypothetical protein